MGFAENGTCVKIFRITRIVARVLILRQVQELTFSKVTKHNRIKIFEFSWGLLLSEIIFMLF